MLQTQNILDGELVKENGVWMVEYIKAPTGYLDPYPAILRVPLNPGQDDEYLVEGQEVKFTISGYPSYSFENSDGDFKVSPSTQIASLYFHTSLESKIETPPVDEDAYSPYCPDCEACGESGCCSPLMCNHTENGHYCKGYLKELQFGYHLYRWIEKHLLEHLPIEKIDEYDKEWNEAYDVFIMNERKQTQ